MNAVESILRKRTMDLFSDDWYYQTSEEICKNKLHTKGCVYLIKDLNSSDVKIGKTTNLNKRMNSYRTYSSKGIYISGVIFTDDINELEKKIHIEYHDKRLKGEWFNLELSDIHDIIVSNKGQFINGIWSRDSYEISEKIFNLKKTSSSVNDNEYFDIIFKFFKTIKMNEYHVKSTYYKKAIKLDKKYENMSKKKFIITLRNYCNHYNYNYMDTTSHGIRKFGIFQ